MKGQESIQIDRPIVEVFNYITDPRNSAYWNAEAERWETLSEPAGHVGGQTRWVFAGNGFEVEAIETVVAYDRPTLFASKHILTQFLRGPAPRPGERPASRQALDQQFRITYGANDPGGLVAVSCEDINGYSTQVTFRVDSQLGGTARVQMWVSKLMGRSRLKDNLQRLKAAIEAL